MDIDNPNDFAKIDDYGEFTVLDIEKTQALFETLYVLVMSRTSLRVNPHSIVYHSIHTLNIYQ